MTKEEEIKFIEFRLKAIFKQDVIRAMDVIIAKDLINTWIKLTKYDPDAGV